MRGSPLVLLCAAAFLADMALYLTMTGAPYRALALGAGPLILGFIPVARALPYSLSTLWAERFTGETRRLRFAPFAVGLAALAAAALSAVSGFAGLYLLLAVIGLMLAFFWPAVQATLADIAHRDSVSGNLGWFNIAWSTGKAAGFVVGGFLLAGFGFRALFISAAGALLGVAALMTVFMGRRVHPHPRDAETVNVVPVTHDPERARRFRLAAWIGNSTAFGIGAVLNHHYPNWLEVLGHDSALFGSYLGLCFASQTAAFAILTRRRSWHFRAAPLLGAQVPLVLVLFFLPRLTSPLAILATAPWVGLGLGMTYFASLYYSVQDAALRGRHAGVHEAVLGIGSMLLPVGGGWVAGATGSLQAPYFFAAFVGLAALGVQGGLLARAKPRKSA